MKRLNEREKQTILGLFTIFIIIILLASAFIGLFMSRNSASDAKDIKKAYENNIVCIDGQKLIDWLYDNVNKLSEQTKEALHIIFVPQIIDK